MSEVAIEIYSCNFSDIHLCKRNEILGGIQLTNEIAPTKCNHKFCNKLKELINFGAEDGHNFVYLFYLNDKVVKPYFRLGTNHPFLGKFTYESVKKIQL